MAITFTRAEEVTPGTPISSRHLVALANAWNDRLKYNLGDPTYRLPWYFESQFKQIRNSDGFLFPPKSEFHRFYQHLEPEFHQYPEAAAGEPGGPNVGSYWPSYVFGIDGAGIDAEEDRLSTPEAGGIPLYVDGQSANTPRKLWELGKRQRGAFDPVTGAVASPAFTAARSHYRLARSVNGPHGNSYGGFLPTPELAGTACSDGDSNFAPTRNVIRFMTNLKTGEVVTFPGTCPREEGHVAFIFPTSDFYIVGTWHYTTEWTYAITYYNAEDWIEGPYSGEPVLRRTSSQFAERVLNKFASEFKGNSDQTGNNYLNREGVKWNKHSFQFERFLTTQYYLAPNNGGESAGSVQGIYRTHWIYGASTITPGTRLKDNVTGSDSNTVPDLCVCPSFILIAQHVTEPCSLDILANGTPVRTVNVTPVDDQYSEIITFSKPYKAGTIFTVRVSSTVRLNTAEANAGIAVEYADLMEYKPRNHDMFLVLRMSASNTSLVIGTDGSGRVCGFSREISDSYFSSCCIKNQYDAGGTGSSYPLSANAVYDCARRWSKCVRILGRGHLVDYAVEGGKSIFWFNRFASGLGAGQAGLPNGMIPSSYEVPSGEIVSGARYYVTGTTAGTDQIDYGGTLYDPGQTFYGTGSTTYDAYGDAKVYVAQGLLGDNGPAADAFDGIAPKYVSISSGRIVDGRKYIVRVANGNGKCFYNGGLYGHDQTFTGVVGMTEYALTTDAVQVFEADGIRAKAGKRDITNEWLMGVWLKHYSHREASTWKLEAHADYLSIYDRCTTLPNASLTPPPDQFRAHFAYGARWWYSPENPTGYRYASHGTYKLNDWQCDDADTDCRDKREHQYRSCQIYQPDTEVEKVEHVWGANGDQIKVTLKKRIHHASTAPGTIQRYSTGTWDITALRAEPYRTLENGIREYIHLIYAGINATQKGNASEPKGDHARTSPLFTLLDDPWGAVIPEFTFVQLIPKPHIDNNDIPGSNDTAFTHEVMQLCELYLRVMCEGFVDGRTSMEFGCETGINGVYDYSFENLMVDAVGQKWATTLPSVATKYISEQHTRPELPQGYGPLPTCRASSEVFNQLVKAVNLLTKVRVPVPWVFEKSEATGTRDWLVVEGRTMDGVISTCTDKPNVGVHWSGYPPDSGVGSFGAWETTTVALSIVYSGPKYETNGSGQLVYVCSGDDWTFKTDRTNVRWRWRPASQDFASFAIPSEWSDMLEANGQLLALRIDETRRAGVEKVAFDVSDQCGPSAGTKGRWNDGSGGYWRFPQTTKQVETCWIARSGSLTAPPVDHSMQAWSWYSGVDSGPCGSGGADNRITIEPIAGADPIIEIPLEDMTNEV